MKIGIHLANGRFWSSPESIVPLGVRAEEWGFDSLWVSDHVVIPTAIESQYPYGPRSAFDPVALQNYFESYGVLSFLAGATKRVQLGVSVLVVPQRPPLLVAKQWATLDALSGGRAILGIGAGWMEEEFRALGMSTFAARGKATDESIKIYRAAWGSDDVVSFAGEVYQFGSVRVVPKPAQGARLPIWVGGHGRRSIRRAAELGDGWHMVRMNLDELRAATATLDELLARYGRTRSEVVVSGVVSLFAAGAGPQNGGQDCELTGSAEQVAAKVKAYQAAGLEHLVLNAQVHDSPAGMHEAVERFATEVLPLVRADR